MPFEVMKDSEGYINDEDLRKFLLIITRPRDKLLFNLLARSGRRVGEILMLKAEDINYFEKTVVWNIEKKRPLKRTPTESKEDFKDRQIEEYERRKTVPIYRSMKPIDNVSLTLLCDYIESENLQKDDKIFKISRFQVYNLTRKYGLLAGFPSVAKVNNLGKTYYVPMVGRKILHPHHFRHTFAVRKSKEMKSPAELEKLRQWLEHSSIATTQQYLRFRMEELRDMVMETI